ncbi:hypothetical protein ADUPG1_007407, partial [Aduncisulcus paluster]
LGEDETLSDLQDKFILAPSIQIGGNSCKCNSEDLGTTPITHNKVCSETKPGVSNTWYVVCASNSYTSYTDASTFACISPVNNDGTFGCSGGCEYGQECRYDSAFNSTSCQQVIVDENLHACVVDSLFESDDTHVIPATDTTPSYFSVASLKTIIPSYQIISEEYLPKLWCPYSSISDLSGIEHLGAILTFNLANNILTDESHLSYLSTLNNLVELNLSSNLLLSTLPDLSSVSLVALGINETSIALSDTSDSTQLIPDSLVELHMYDTPTVQAGFDTQVGSSHLSGLKMISIGNTTSITSIYSLSTSLETLYIADTTSISDLQLTLDSMSSLHSVKFDNIGLSSIPDFSASSAYLTFIDLSNNGGISSVYPIISSELTYLETFICTNCSISDLSPLYSLPNLLTISVVGNKICVGSSESTEDLAEKFKNHGVAG